MKKPIHPLIQEIIDFASRPWVPAIVAIGHGASLAQVRQDELCPADFSAIPGVHKAFMELMSMLPKHLAGIADTLNADLMIDGWEEHLAPSTAGVIAAYAITLLIHDGLDDSADAIVDSSITRAAPVLEAAGIQVWPT